MIALIRIRTAKAINSKFRGADKKEWDKELMFAQRTYLNDINKPVVFKSKFWKTAKNQLKKESNGKCAYCEANTQVVAYGDVEHFRPKSIYWWLAYTYDNYLYTCQICNQIYKSDNFSISGIKFPEPILNTNTTDQAIEQLVGNISPDPIDITINYSFQTYVNSHREENAHLINPYFDDPTDYFAYEADDVLEEVKIIAIKPQAQMHVKASEDFYGINRIELKNARYDVFRIFRLLKKSYLVLTDEPIKRDTKKQIEFMLSDKYLFAGMNRFFNKKL